MNTSKLPAYRWVVLAVVCLLCFMANYMQFQVSALATIIMPDLGIDAAGFSTLLLMPMLTAVFFSIPLGSLGDRFGSKKVVAVCTFISVLGGFLRCYANDFVLQLVAMFMIGAGISALNANLAKILGTWFQEKTESAMGVFYACSCVGIVVAQVASGLFGSVFNSYMVAAVALAISWVLWIVLDRDLPDGVEALPPEPVVKYLAVAARSKNVWIIGIGVGFGLASTTAYAGLLPQALELGKGIDAGMAGLMAAIVTVGSAFGSIVGPMVSQKLGRMKPFLMLMTAVGAAVMFGTWYAPDGGVLWVILVLNGFFTAISGPIMQAMPYLLPEIRAKYAGSAGGLVGTVSLLLSFCVPIVLSAIAGEDYALNLGLESLCFLLSIVCIALLPELGAKGKIAQEIVRLEAMEASAESSLVETA